MKIEVGKSYRTRDGRKAAINQIVSMFTGGYPVAGYTGGMAYTWKLDGRFEETRTSGLDLVAPWEEEFKPKRGDKVYIPEIDETRIFLAEIEGARNPIVTVCGAYNGEFNNGKPFSISVYESMEPIKVEENLVHLTFEDISNGKGKGVPSHLIRIKE